MEFPFVFSHAVDSESTRLLALDGLGLIRATGPEARSFLQNQLTNDAKAISPAQGQLSGYCSPKGRLLAVLTLLQLGEDDFALSLPAALVAPTLKRLKMFVLRSKLGLSDASAALPALGIIGAAAADALARAGLSAPATDYGVAHHADCWVQQRPGPVPRFVLWAAPERLAGLRAALALPAANTDDWALAEVLAGVPQVLPATVDAFVPQTIDLDTASGVSFTKGCYPGQEIVARVHYLGRIKQRLRLAKASRLVAPGTSVQDGEGHSVGTVMAVATHPRGGTVLALSLNLSHAGGTPLRAADGAVDINPQSVVQSRGESPIASAPL